MRLSLKVLAAAGAVVFLGSAVHCGGAPNHKKRPTLPELDEPSPKRLPRASVIAPPSQPARDLLNSLLEESTSGLKAFSVDVGARWNLFCNRLDGIAKVFAVSVLESALGPNSPIVKDLLEIASNTKEENYHPDLRTAANLDAKSQFGSITNEMSAILKDASEYFETVGPVTLNLASEETQKGISEALVEFFSKLVVDGRGCWRVGSSLSLWKDFIKSLEELLDQLEPGQALKISQLLWGAMKKLRLGNLVVGGCLKPVVQMTLKYVAQQEPTMRIRQEGEFEVKMDGSLVLKGTAPPLREPRWLDDFDQRVLYTYKHFKSEVEEVVERVTDDLAFQSRVISLLIYPGIYPEKFIPNNFFIVSKIRDLGQQLFEFGALCHKQRNPTDHHLSKYLKIYEKTMRRLKESFEQAVPLSEYVRAVGLDFMKYLRAYYPALPMDD